MLELVVCCCFLPTPNRRKFTLILNSVTTMLIVIFKYLLNFTFPINTRFDIYILFTIQIPKSRHRRGTQGETPNSIPGNWCAYRGWRAEWKTITKRKTGSGSPTQLPWTIRWAYSFYPPPHRPTWGGSGFASILDPIWSWLYQRRYVYHLVGNLF